MAACWRRDAAGACSLQRQQDRTECSQGNPLQSFIHVREESSIASKATTASSTERKWDPFKGCGSPYDLTHRSSHSCGDKILHISRQICFCLVDRNHYLVCGRFWQHVCDPMWKSGLFPPRKDADRLPVYEEAREACEVILTKEWISHLKKISENAGLSP